MEDNKKKRIIIIIIIIITLLIIGTICLIISQVLKTKKEESTEPKVGDLITDYEIYEKTTSRKGKDGWYYCFTLQGMDNVKEKGIIIEKKTYYFMGVNLKYEHIDGYEIPVYETNEKGEEVLVSTIKTFPNLYVSPREKNGVKESDEVNKLQDYFTDKQFDREITLEDLNELNLEFFDKKFIMEMYNEMIKQEFTSKENNYPHASYNGQYRKDNLQDGYKWQTSFLIERSRIHDIHIEMIYEDGTYLSDYIDSKKSNKRQKEIAAHIKQIRNYIVDNQSLEFDGVFNDLKEDKDFKRLFALLDSYHEPIELEYQER